MRPLKNLLGGPPRLRAGSVLLMLVAGTRPCAAYTDPGSGLLIWQTLGAAGIGLLFYFYRIIHKLRLTKSSRDRTSQRTVERQK